MKQFYLSEFEHLENGRVKLFGYAFDNGYESRAQYTIPNITEEWIAEFLGGIVSFSFEGGLKIEKDGKELRWPKGDVQFLGAECVDTMANCSVMGVEYRQATPADYEAMYASIASMTGHDLRDICKRIKEAPENP